MATLQFTIKQLLTQKCSNAIAVCWLAVINVVMA